MPNNDDHQEKEADPAPQHELPPTEPDLKPVPPPELSALDVEPYWPGIEARRALRRLVQDDPGDASAQHHWHPGRPSPSDHPAAPLNAFAALGVPVGRDRGRPAPSPADRTDERTGPGAAVTPQSDPPAAQLVLVPTGTPDIPSSQSPHASAQASPQSRPTSALARVLTDRQSALSPEALFLLCATLLFVYLLRRMFRRI